jgi:hypothetical protein
MKMKKKQPKNKRKSSKKTGAILLAPNPKTCTQYKEKINQLTNESKE